MSKFGAVARGHGGCRIAGPESWLVAARAADNTGAERRGVTLGFRHASVTMESIPSGAAPPRGLLPSSGCDTGCRRMSGGYCLIDGHRPRRRDEVASNTMRTSSATLGRSAGCACCARHEVTEP
jgi:hypothetical protein